MSKSQYNRRNFLSSLAILSVGTSFASPLKPLSNFGSQGDLRGKWASFYKKAGGRSIATTTGLNDADLAVTPGHYHANGQTIFFEKENILARPTWIFWGDDESRPADVVLSIYDSSATAKRITRLNRFDVEALFKLSGTNNEHKLLLSLCNSAKPAEKQLADRVKSKTLIYRNSQVQQVSYYKADALVFHKKFIYHT